MDFETDTRVLFNSLAAKRRSGKSGSRDSSDCYDSSKLWLQCDSSGIMAVWWKLLHILVGIPRYLATSKQSMVKGSELGSAEGHKNHKGLWSSTKFRNCEDRCWSAFSAALVQFSTMARQWSEIWLCDGLAPFGLGSQSTKCGKLETVEASSQYVIVCWCMLYDVFSCFIYSLAFDACYKNYQKLAL